MPRKLESAIDAWRKADALARQAEARLAESLKEFEQRRGPEVPRELIEQVAQLREHANRRLTTAITTISRRDEPAVPDRRKPQ